MLNLNYVLPKEEDQGQHEGETVETSTKHIFEDTTPEVVQKELKKLLARGFDVAVSFKVKVPK